MQVPEKPMKQIMEKRVLHIMRTGGESRFADLLSVTNPWVEGELVMTCRRVTDCDCSIAGKVGLFQRLLFNKVLVPTSMEGESSSDMVAGVCAECLRSLEQVDVVDYSAARCITVYECVAKRAEAFRGDSFGCAIGLCGCRVQPLVRQPLEDHFQDQGPDRSASADPRLLLERHWVRERHRQCRVLARFAEESRRRVSREAGCSQRSSRAPLPRRCGVAWSISGGKCRRTASAGQT